MENGKREWWEEPPSNELDGLPPATAAKLIEAGITTVQDVRETGEEYLRSLKLRSGGIERIKVWLRERLRPDIRPEEDRS